MFRRGLILLSAAVLLFVAAVPAGATGVAHGDTVNEAPKSRTPEFLDNEVRANIQVGNRIIVGGDFTQVRDDTFGVVNQANLAAYDLTTGRLDMNFRPDVDGGVNSLVDAGDGTIIAVGIFNAVNGTTRRSTAKINVVDGSLVTAFKANANAEVQDVAISGNTVYIGGTFSLVNSIPRSRLAAVDRTTGNVKSNFDFPITEGTGYRGADGVRSLDTTPDGKTLVVGHNAHRVAGQVRQNLALIDIDGAPSLKNWKTDHYDYDCHPNKSITRPLMRDVQVSPDGSYLVAVTSIGNFAPGCDVAVKFPVSGGSNVEATWVSRLFDTPEAVAISDEAVYIGGHFRWLQDTGTHWSDWPNGNTSDQPDNTVTRQQIGALDPSTGTALDWDPGATGARGVLALRVSDAGLLVGSDGEWIGGKRVYRHGLLELPSPGGGDTSDPSVTITEPSNGQLVDNTVYFRGAASDNRGLADVLLSVQNLDTGQFMQFGGVFNNDGWQLHRTFVPDAYSTSSDWLWTATLPDGNYRITARADDLAGNRGSFERLDFRVGNTNDTEDPKGTLAVPSNNQVFPNGNLTFRGAASDDVSVAEVNLVVRDLSNNDYLQDNGTFAAAWNKVPANLSNPGTAFTQWSWSGNLPDGNYKMNVQAKDGAGNSDPTKPKAKFTIGLGDTAPPNGTLKVPSNKQVFTKNQVDFRGAASDNVGVDSVSLVIKDLETKQYMRPNGSFGASFRSIPATLANRGAGFTRWTWSGSIPDGDYRVTVQVKDAARNKDPDKATARISVE